MTTALTTTVATARACPFVGPRSFRFGEPLFGRGREVTRLLNLLIAERIVLMFSPSGAGKTSLIQAGLIPALREEDFFDLPIIRVQQPATPEAAGALQVNRFLRGTLESLERPRPGVDQAHPEHLTGHGELAPAVRQWADSLGPTADGRAPNLVLIFDQFEEILTTDPADFAAKEAFFDQLGSALRDPGLWALFAMREEYIAALEPFLNRIPRRLASRFRLDLLDAQAAREAFEKTFQSGDISVAPEAATRIVDDLRGMKVQRPDGTSEKVLGPHVEPVHLQIVGLRLWNRYGSDPSITLLDETHLSGTEGSVNSALVGYYADNAREIGASTGVGERAVREWCEGQLITDQGLRGQVLRGHGQTLGLPEPVIQKLIDAFLVRAEVRHGLTWYELAHDRLIEPVRDDNHEWRQQHLHPSLLRAADWERADRSDSLLLRDRELEEAELWAGANETLLTALEREYLDLSRSEWDAEQRSRRATRLVIATGIGVLLCATLGFIYLWRRAEGMRVRAENERQRTEQLSREAWRRNSELLIERGIALCQQGRVDHGLLWLMRGLEHVHKLNPADPTLDHLARLELAAWRAELTTLGWFQRSGREVNAVALSPDGRTVLIGTRDKEMRLWNAASGRLWDVASGRPKGPPLEYGGDVPPVALSPDGRTVLTGGPNNTARLWDAESGRQVGPLEHGPIKSPAGNLNRVVAVAFGPDGHTALTGSSDHTARLWDVESRRPKDPPLPHDDTVDKVALSPDGRTALTVCRNKARLWDVGSGRLKGPPLEHDHDRILAVGFGPDGPVALTGTSDHAEYVPGPDMPAVLTHERPDFTVRLWDVESRLPKGPPLKIDEAVKAVAMSSGGRTVLTSSGDPDRPARLWDLVSGRPKDLPLKHDAAVNAVAMSPDGRTALTVCEDGTARVWILAPGQPRGTTLKHPVPVSSVAMSPNGRTVLTGYGEETQLWDVGSGRPKGPPLEPDGSGFAKVLAVAFGPDGRTALISNLGPTQLWDVESRQPKGPPLNAPLSPAVAMSPDGRTALTGGLANIATLWDAESGRQMGLLLEHGPPLAPDGKDVNMVVAVAFGPDGRIALTGSTDHTARLWDVGSGQPGCDLRLMEVKNVSEIPTKGKALLIAADLGDRVLFRLFDHDGRMAMEWMARDINEMRLPDLAGQVDDLKKQLLNLWLPGELSADEKNLLVSAVRSIVGHGRQPKGAPLKHDAPVLAVAMSPDGRTALTGCENGTARLWDVQTQNPIGLPMISVGAVKSVAYSPDGTMVLTSSTDATAQPWLVQTQSPIGAPFSHHGAVNAVSFSPDGRWIATASDDKTAQLWQTPTAVEGSAERLALWVRVLTRKEMDQESREIRSLDLDTWQKAREQLDRLGGPPDQTSAGGSAVSPPR
jgi:WD40 repeat protein